MAVGSVVSIIVSSNRGSGSGLSGTARLEGVGSGL